MILEQYDVVRKQTKTKAGGHMTLGRGVHE